MTVSYQLSQTRQVRSADDSETDFNRSPPADVASISLPLMSDLLLIGEVAIVFFAAIIAKIIYINGFLHSSQGTLAYAGLGLIGAFISLVTFRQAGLYESNRLLDRSVRAGRLFASLCLAMLILLFLLYLLKVSQQYSRAWMVTWLVLTYMCLLAERMILRLYTRALVAEGRLAQRIAVCGSRQICASVRDYLDGNPKVRIVGVFDDRREALGSAAGVSDGGLDELIALGQKTAIDRIIIALPAKDVERINRVLDELSILPNEIDFCPEFVKLPLPSRATHNIGRLPLFEVLSWSLRPEDYFLKAVVDYVLGSIALIVLLPVFAAIAIAIKLDSAGPVFFIQRRHGYNHQVIRVYKFRSMTVCEDDGVIEQARKNDRRVTRVGRFLRRTSLDELPQLINVLKGEMSLVGPRPHALVHNELYNKQVERYANRHRVKPGITGWAQVKGWRGETADNEQMRKRIEHDLWYIENWSLALDFAIMARTLLISWRHPRAY